MVAWGCVGKCGSSISCFEKVIGEPIGGSGVVEFFADIAHDLHHILPG